MNIDPKYNWLFVKHVKQTESVWLPFVKFTRRSACYYLDRFRYGKWFEKGDGRLTGKPTSDSDFAFKAYVQNQYQKECEEQGAILRAMFVARNASENSQAVDYLRWLTVHNDMYESYAEGMDGYPDMTFMQFMQSELVPAKALELENAD